MKLQPVLKFIIFTISATSVAFLVTSCRSDSFTKEIEAFLNDLSGSSSGSPITSNLILASDKTPIDYAKAHSDGYALGYAMAKLSEDEKFQAGYQIGYEAAKKAFSVDQGKVVATATSTVVKPPNQDLRKVPSWGYEESSKAYDPYDYTAPERVPTPVIEPDPKPVPKKTTSSSRTSRSSYRCSGGR